MSGRISRHVRKGVVAAWAPVAHFMSRDPLTFAASIAFYTALSFAPMLVLSLWVVAGLSPGSEQRLVDQMGALLGSQVRDIASVIVENANSVQLRADVAGIVSLGALVVSASTAFAQLQASINALWSVDAVPTNAAWTWIRRRLLSFGILAVIGFLLIVTLVFSSVMTMILSRESATWVVVNELIALSAFTVAFASLFHFVPDVRVPFRYALLGGVVTALLFVSGKWALGKYLGATTTADAYGAANSLILMLLWVYYSSFIVLIGAATTFDVASRFHAPLRYSRYSRAPDTPTSA